MYKIALIYTPHLTRAAAMLGGIIGLSLFLYSVFLLEAVAHTATRAQAQSEIHTTTSRLSTLEAQYLSLTGGMTEAKAEELGFVRPTEVSTVFATNAAHSLGYTGALPHMVGQ